MLLARYHNVLSGTASNDPVLRSASSTLLASINVDAGAVLSHFSYTKRVEYDINIQVQVPPMSGSRSVPHSSTAGMTKEHQEEEEEEEEEELSDGRLDDESVHRKSIRHSIVHVQGVDTVCIPSSIMSLHTTAEANDSSSASTTTTGVSFSDVLEISIIVSYFHAVCPSSYYQDDYVIAYLLHIANVRVISLWSPSVQVVDHVEGVSKSHDQMHMKTDEVQRHEEETQQCVIDYANRINDVLYLCKHNHHLCSAFRQKLLSER